MAMKTTSKERRDAAIVKTVERILRQAERPIETDISLKIRQDEVITVNYYIKEAIIPKEENEEADNDI